MPLETLMPGVWDRLILAFGYTTLLVLILRVLWLEFRVRQSFTTLRLDSRRGLGVVDWGTYLEIVVSAGALFVSTAPQGSERWFGAAGAIALLIYYWRAPLRCQEHGLVIGFGFVYWNSISKVEWNELPGSGWTQLLVSGPWWFRRKVLFATEQRQILEPIIKGASRFERRSAVYIFVNACLAWLTWCMLFAAVGTGVYWWFF